MWPFQSVSRGHRTGTAFAGGLRRDLHGSPMTVIDAPDDEDDDQEDLGAEVVLGKGSPASVSFEWAASEWSRCSETCGGDGGFKVRAAQCMVRLRNATQPVDAQLCEDAGLQMPETVARCGEEQAAECTRWTVGEWTPCEKSKCFTWRTGEECMRSAAATGVTKVAIDM